MCLSPFFATVIGFYLFLVSLAIIVHPHRSRKDIAEFLSDHPLLCLSGGLSVLLGLILVISHNIWVLQWPIAITLIGWLLLLQGICRLFCPDQFIRGMKKIVTEKRLTYWAWAWLVVGVYLIWMAFYLS